MEIPPELFSSQVTDRNIYFFTCEDVDGEHPFILVKRTDKDVLLFAVSTSQFETQKRLIKERNLPAETLVRILPEKQNKLSKESFVNCNRVFQYDMESFRKKYENGGVTFAGTISAIYYEQIIIGLICSPLVEEEIKTKLPDPNDII